MDNTVSFEAISDDFEFPLWYNIYASCLQWVVFCLILVVNRRVLSFLKRHPNRCVNVIIGIQSKMQCFMAPIICLIMVNLHWNQFFKKVWKHIDLHTEWCYFGSYVFYFFFFYNCLHSLVIAIFRYICILHPCLVGNLGTNAPKVK